MAALSQGPWLTLRKFPLDGWKKPTSGPAQNGHQSLSMSPHQAPEKMGPLVWNRLMEAQQVREPMSPSPQRLPYRSGCQDHLPTKRDQGGVRGTKKTVMSRNAGY